MIQLLLHLFGDFILQNDYVGTRKKEKSLTGRLYCIYHCITYALPFFLVTDWRGVILIGLGHFIIDRWMVVAHFIKLKNFQPNIDNLGYTKETPKFMSTWLYIIQDNTIHLIWNFFIIYLLK